MSETQLYRVMLAISEEADAEAWIRLALRMMPEEGEILLRGMITIEEDHSLSEGTLRAQHLRDRFDDLATVYPMIRNDKWVRVDYDPFERILGEASDFPVDLLLAEWRGPKKPTGGITTNTILQHIPADVCLIGGQGWEKEGPVLLSLRGGPNIALGLRVSKAMTPEDEISLLNAAENPEDAAELFSLLGTEGGISRVVAIRSEIDLKQSIVKEATGHKAIVMGAAFYETVSGPSITGEVVEETFEQTDLPFVLIRAWDREALDLAVPQFITKREQNVSTRVDRWFAENSFDGDEFDDIDMLMGWKERQGVTISIALPALNEEESVGNVIQAMKTKLMDEVPLLDEMVVIDGGSTDRTEEIVTSMGIPFHKAREILPEMGFAPGKGEALWKSQYVLNGDIIGWIDTDIKNIHPRFVYGIIGPLLKHQHIQYVKGFYHRPIKVGNQLQAYGGGRVTELVARPLLNLFYPELSGIVQPLAGEYAGRRSALERVPFFSGYGVETGLLIDLHNLFGLDAIAQTNLKERVHHNQPLGNLSRMSFAILQVFISRIEQRYGVKLLDYANRSMKTIMQTDERLELNVNEIGDQERPPMIELEAYLQREFSIATPQR